MNQNMMLKTFSFINMQFSVSGPSLFLSSLLTISIFPPLYPPSPFSLLSTHHLHFPSSLPTISIFPPLYPPSPFSLLSTHHLHFPSSLPTISLFPPCSCLFLPSLSGSVFFNVPESAGWEYAKVSSDYNLHHLNSFTAKFVGYPRPMVHGMWTLSRVMAILNGKSQFSLFTCDIQ